MHGGNFRNVGWARSVGGDFYDWYPTPDGGAAVTLGDVMGKGVGAGMIAAAIRAVVRSSRDNPDPAAALRSATAGISTGPGTATSGQFTTCFHARISRNGVLCWVDAGHGLTVLRRAAGVVSFLQSGHLPIGVGTGWVSLETVLEPGDSIVSVSDGVLDLFGGDLRSLDAYAAFVAERPSITEIVEELTALAQQQEQPDDVTVLQLLRRLLRMPREDLGEGQLQGREPGLPREQQERRQRDERPNPVRPGSEVEARQAGGAV
ncbi:PP2C family protein-serine/threonine phosphatase [Curtobacterium sp. B8]|uniref:PP2C family protein-serine/threonine phosphatase n=1 Tax=Curtobacterium sp. B8 TaxID=95611 RepID=UPI0021C90E19|nr:PP2C family protein-serine/threonine phosphatase [Curtobacterium sp. B8]